VAVMRAEPFDKLKTPLVEAHPLRQAQRTLFDKLRAPPSTGSGRMFGAQRSRCSSLGARMLVHQTNQPPVLSGEMLMI
jgi:hypothetical protein